MSTPDVIARAGINIPGITSLIVRAGSELLDYIFVEYCRICQALIVKESSPAHTVCAKCFEPLQKQEAQIDYCQVSGFQAIQVAHAAMYDDHMKTLIYRLKYHQDRLIAQDLGLLLLKAYAAISRSAADGAKPVLVPIPLSYFRKIRRGFNQSELLAKYIERQTNVQVANKMLVRPKHTRPQHQLNKQERASNLRAAFKCSDLRMLEKGTRIILVDDIHTSGSTLAEAAVTLSAGGAENIAAITVARASLTDEIKPGRKGGSDK